MMGKRGTDNALLINGSDAANREMGIKEQPQPFTPSLLIQVWLKH